MPKGTQITRWNTVYVAIPVHTHGFMCSLSPPLERGADAQAG